MSPKTAAKASAKHWEDAAPTPIDPGAFGNAVAAALAKEGHASLILTDLDDFLGVNERAGRDVGDRAITAVSGVLAKAAQAEGWTFARIGGDEFALLAPGVTLEAAFLRADQLRQELNAAIAKALPNGVRCTTSVGVASAPRDAKTADELKRKSDLALYAAKEQGGNAVGLVPSAEMVLRSSYFGAAQLGRLRSLAERLKKKDASLLREALDDLLRKYERS